MSAFLTMTRGDRSGTVYPLLKSGTRIGRGMDCEVVLTDPRSSRVHAVIRQTQEGWWLADSSLNGTYVNGQKIDDAQLLEGCVLRIGGTEFEFHESAERASNADAQVTQMIVQDSAVDPSDTGPVGIAALRDESQAQDFLMLYQLSIKLLGCDDPDDVVRVSLDLLFERTKASVVGFLWVNDSGKLKPKLVIPQDSAGKVHLSASLTDVVCRQRRAIWINSQGTQATTESLALYADALCVPLIRNKETLGAIHLYRERGRFQSSDFEVARSLANIMCVALVRAREQARLAADHARLVHKSANFDELVGDSQPMIELKGKIARIARASGCVLIRGESGAGKELVARALHRASPRSDRPMLSVNCAAMPRDLMESQLFGHRKGAFTGADSDHVGWFQQADSGTLFLDEVGELTLEGQAKLLRILEGYPFLPVGGTKEISVDVRIIAATNRDLQEFVREKRFREDLFYRLTVFPLYIPPLRDRGPDIERLANFFFEHFKLQHGRPGLGLADETRQRLISYSWPGNVRQLRNVIDSAVVMADGDTILPSDLGLHDAGQNDELETLRLDYWERKLITQALGRCDGKVPEAAKLLGIGRATLYRKIEEYKIDR